MHSYGKALRLAFAVSAIVTSVVSVCAAADVNALDEAPESGEASQPAVSRNTCLPPRAILSTETCREYARCCSGAEFIDPATAATWACSYSRAGARSTCHCSIAAALDVRCDGTARGVRCRCM
jgi:hypothetical protein